MAGQAKKIIDAIIEQRSAGNSSSIPFIRAKLAMKGFDLNNYTETSKDDAYVIQGLKRAATEMGVDITHLITPQGAGAAQAISPTFDRQIQIPQEESDSGILPLIIIIAVVVLISYFVLQYFMQ